MNIDQIQANKPQGATHYTETVYGVIYCKIMRNQVYGYDGSWYGLYGHINLKPL